MLHYINNQVWKTLFGRAADGIEQSIDDDDEYRIIDHNPLTNKFTSSGQDPNGEVKRKFSSSSLGGDAVANLGPNSANFIAGIIEGILCSSKMYCKCSAHYVP